MSDNSDTTIDFVRELRLRQWARHNYVVAAARKATWHPVVLDEMRLRDVELSFTPTVIAVAPVAISGEAGIETTEPRLTAEIDFTVSCEYQSPLDGSGIVPLMPGTNLFLDEGTSEIPKPHARLLGQIPAEFAQSAEFATFD